MNEDDEILDLTFDCPNHDPWNERKGYGTEYPKGLYWGNKKI